MQSPEGFLGGTRPLSVQAEGSSSRMAPHLERELIFLVLQFLDEENFSETIHTLEKEAGVYFNMKHLGDAMLVGDWETAENYVSGFITINESAHSAMVFFHLSWNKYFDTMMRGDKAKALDVLNKELKFFEPSYPEHYKKAVQCLTVPSCMGFSSPQSLRVNALFEIHNVIAAHPILRNKLHFPSFSSRRLRSLLLNLQSNGATRSAIPNIFKER